MTANILPFRHPKHRRPSADELVQRVRALLAQDTDNVRFDNPHVKTRMAQRVLVMRQVIEACRLGECVSGPTLDDYGDWRIKLRRVVAGRRVQVVVAVKEDHFVVVTAI